MKNIFFIPFFLFIGQSVFAQDVKKEAEQSKKTDTIAKETKKDIAPYNGQSIFEDKDGKSAIFLPEGGTFRINTADASLKFSFANRVSNRKLFYGLEVTGKTNDGLLPMITNGDISPGTKINGVIGLQELIGNPLLDGWLVLKLGYEGSSFKLFSPTADFANQIQKKSFNTFTSSLSFNLKIGGHRLFAISAGYQKANNYNDLTEMELKDEWSTTNSSTSTTRSYERKTKVRGGTYETFDQIPINLDFYWYLADSKRIGMYHYTRSKFNNGKLTNGIGSGIYLLKKDQPLSSILGIVFEVNDIAKLKEGYGKNFTLSFLVAHNFSFAN